MYIEELLERISNYEPQYKDLILRAFEFAREVHKDVKRKSGEPYIIHPVAVACILAEMKADADTIAAGLLHDTIEDGDGVTKELIEAKFNSTIANLVDGVTNIKKYETNNDKERAAEETRRKIIESVLKDIRIMIIKLADRLHNMRTLEFQPRNKQLYKAQETIEFFVPFAYLIGAYHFKLELEDLSFKYLNPTEFMRMQEILKQCNDENRDVLDEIVYTVSQLLSKENIPFELKIKIKNAYGLYRRLNHYSYIGKVYDVFQLKYILNDEQTCYYLRDKVSGLYTPIPEKGKDYIYNPKPNLYRGLHTVVEGPNSQKFQFQMNTKNMYMINSYGLPAYWSTMSLQHAAERMQNDVKTLQFYKLLEELAGAGEPTRVFNQHIKDAVLTSNIYVRTPNDEIIELPKGATPIDFAYYLHTELGNYITGASVNGVDVPLDTQLVTGDLVHIAADTSRIGPFEDLTDKCVTERAKRKIKEFMRKQEVARKQQESQKKHTLS